jgi:hypothetical protein
MADLKRLFARLGESAAAHAPVTLSVRRVALCRENGVTAVSIAQSNLDRCVRP